MPEKNLLNYKEKDFVQGWFALLSLLAVGVALGSNIAWGQVTASQNPPK